jgi:hypothetical protein
MRDRGAHRAHLITRAVIRHRLAPQWALPWLEVVEIILTFWRIVAR